MPYPHIHLHKVGLILITLFWRVSGGIGNGLFLLHKVHVLTRIWSFDIEAISLRRRPNFSVACDFNAVLGEGI